MQLCDQWADHGNSPARLVRFGLNRTMLSLAMDQKSIHHHILNPEDKHSHVIILQVISLKSSLLIEDDQTQPLGHRIRRGSKKNHPMCIS
jgi:hypothetical protein